MQVSFIIPLFDNLALTRACVESLQATLPAGLAHEIILVDDGSTDGTRAWLATLASPFRVVLNERNLGYAGANNRAAVVAQGELLVLLNNDLVLLPRWFEPLLAAHRSLGARAGLVGNVQLDARTGAVDHTGIIIGQQAKPIHDRALPPFLSQLVSPVRRVPAATGACLMIGRTLWQQLGGFDEGYVNGGEDVDLCYRARAAGRTNAVALRSRVRHHISASAGRKLRDEENSRRLALRWQTEFRTDPAALREWCRLRFEQILIEPRDHDAALGRHIFFHLCHLRRTAPPEAYAALEAALAEEFARWDRILPPAR